jgi:predicted nuclease of restriction endonuclease-like (RecB) superfamily
MSHLLYGRDTLTKEVMNYPALLKEIKDRIRQGQLRASMAVNVELLSLYWDVGRIVAERQGAEGWGAGIIPRLAHDIRNELPEIKGFSARNIDRMLAFYREYKELGFSPPAVAKIEAADTDDAISSPAVAKLLPSQELHEIYEIIFRLPWAHNVILLGVKDRAVRIWYMQRALEHGWSRDWLASQIKANLHSRQGRAVTNFSLRLPDPQSALAQETLKDPYKFDFLTLEEQFHERELETGLVAHVEKFLLELGAGFAFLGRQYHLTVGESDFYVDLLLYHTKLRCYVVVELKNDEFRPEHAGKVNFYCTAIDDLLRSAGENPTIGLILCLTQDRVVAEYTLRNVNAPIGVSEYELTRALPDSLKSSLPTVEEIEERFEEKS